MEQIDRLDQTICAVSTPPGRGGIAIIRLSGPEAIDIADKVWRGKPLAQADTHTAHLGTLTDIGGQPLDQAVATVFRAPRSFTGENVVEISVHGSTYIQQQALDALCGAGARIAEPGEFTRRAYTNGRLDLAEAEAVADVIASSSNAAHRLAISQLSGKFSAHVNDLHDRLTTLAALLELELDFSEEDVTFADRSQLRALAVDILEFTTRMADTFAAGNAIRQGIPVAIIGRPNVGKSSLLNAILGADRAIVSDIPGTTRDTIEDTIEIDGHMLRFIDTAGIRNTDDPIESLGISRALDSASRARIVIKLVTPDQLDDNGELLAQLGADTHTIVAVNKIDTVPDIEAVLSRAAAIYGNAYGISALTGAGVNDLLKHIIDTAIGDLPSDESMIVTNARHHQALREAAAHLADLITAIDTSLTPDLMAQHLRLAIASLAAITGTITSQDILNTIFSRFCIGK